MKISQKGLYALQAMMMLARHYSQGAIRIRYIAYEEDLPEKFLELILLELKNARIVEPKGTSAALARFLVELVGYEAATGIDPETRSKPAEYAYTAAWEVGQTLAELGGKAIATTAGLAPTVASKVGSVASGAVFVIFLIVDMAEPQGGPMYDDVYFKQYGMASESTTSPPANKSDERQNVTTAYNQAKSASSEKTSTGENPLFEVYRQRASESKRLATQYAGLAKQSYAAYQQANAQYKGLMSSFNNTDFFNYFLGAQQAKQMADQAYAQYQDYSERSSQLQRQYRKYLSLYDNL